VHPQERREHDVEASLLIVRFLLAAVFLIAAVAKLFDRAGTRKAVGDFGVPAPLVATAATLVPLAELAAGILLIPATTAWWGAIGAAGLLIAFIIGIAVNLARGRRPGCQCFGQLHPTPVGWTTLARNALLLGAAGLVVWRGPDRVGPTAAKVLGDLSGVEIAALAAGVVVLGLLLVLGMMVLELLRQNGRLLVRIEAIEGRLGGEELIPQGEAAAAHAGLPIGSPAPGFTLSGIRGETLTLDFLTAAQRPVLLLFARPGCGPCEALVPQIEQWQQQHSATMTIAVISEGMLEVNREKFGGARLPSVLVQRGREVADAYEVSATPGAVVVRPDGTVASGLAEGPDQIRALVEETLALPRAQAPIPVPLSAQAPAPPIAAANGNGNGAFPAQAPPLAQTAPPSQAPPPAVGIGERPPSISLSNVNGKRVNIAQLRGGRTLLLFWNPGCGFCQQMLDDLRAWEVNRPNDAPKLVVISTGSVESNKALALRSPVLQDEDFTVAPAFGANGTPMAVLLNGQGRVSSRVAVGAAEVFALARDELEQPV
jgi:peroxiredoxin/uncharacterized membrane protein YphA (DoxX/SURF4 family)